MSVVTAQAPVAVRHAAFRQDGEASNATLNHDTGVAAGRETSDASQPRPLQRSARTMSSAAPSGKTMSLRHAATDELRSSQNDFRGRGTAWAIICIALCAVTGFTFAYFYTAHFEWQASSVWALVSASILRAVGLCAVMVPALFHRTGFRLERRRTFVFLCLLSLMSVVAAWVLWHFRSPKWPQVLLTVSDVFSAIAGAQLVISSAYELTAMPYDRIDMDARWAELEAQHTH